MSKEWAPPPSLSLHYLLLFPSVCSSMFLFLSNLWSILLFISCSSLSPHWFVFSHFFFSFSSFILSILSSSILTKWTTLLSFSIYSISHSEEIEVRLLSSPSFLLTASKNGQWASVCDDGFSIEYASTVCAIFQFGWVFVSSSSINNIQYSSFSQSLPSAPSSNADSLSWNLQCLRNEKCTAPTQRGCMQMRLSIL